MKIHKIAVRAFATLLTVVTVLTAIVPTAAAIDMEDVGSVVGPIASQFADAYKQAYQDAKDNGIIDQINAFFDEAKEVFKQTEQWIDDNGELLESEELERELCETLKNAEVTVERLRELINNADEIDEESLSYAMKLLDALYVNVADLFDLLRIASEMVGEHVSPEIEALIAEAEKNIADLGKTAAEIIAELQLEADERIAELTAEAEEKIAALRHNASERVRLLGELLSSADDEEKERIYEEIRRVEDELAQDVAEVEQMLAHQIASITEWLFESIEKINQKFDLDIASITAKLGEAVDSLMMAVSELSRLAGMDETLGEAFRFIEGEVNKIWSQAYEYISETVEKYTTVEYSVHEESFFLAIGVDTAYAPILADKLSLRQDQHTALNWDQLTPEIIKKADLISISFNENQMNGFAVDQMLGYVADYINAELRGDFILYVEEAVSEFLSAAVPILKPLISKKVTEVITESVNMGLDAFCEVQLGGKTATELDWAAVVGEEYVESIDALCETMREEVSRLGIEENYAYEISVVDLIYDNLQNLEDLEQVEPEVLLLLKLIGKEAFAEFLGEYSTYTLNIPMSDAVMFSGESYVYNYIQFTKQYSQNVTEIAELNPDAKIILLGHYNAFGGIRFEMGDISVDIGSVYESLARIACVTPFAHVLFVENATYVDIFDAQTVYGARISEGESADVLVFAFNYMTDRTLTNISESGHEYVCDQILRSMKEEVEEPPAQSPPAPTPEQPKEPSKGILVAAVTGTTAIVVIASYAVASLVKRKKRPADNPEAQEE